MALIEILTVSSAALIGTGAYQQHRQPRSLVDLLQPIPQPSYTNESIPNGIRDPNAPWLEKIQYTSIGRVSAQVYVQVKEELTTVKARVEHSLTANARPTQLSPTQESDAQLKAREARLRMRSHAKKMLPIMGAITVASALGALFAMPVLSVASGGILLALTIPLLPVYYRDLRAGKISIDHLGVIVVLGSLGLGSIFAACLNSLVLLSRYALLARIEDDSMNNMVDVFREQPRTVWLLADGVEVEVPLEEVKQGDIVVVGAGSIIPVDGEIRSGVASVDQHILTGESQPAEMRGGDSVFALTTVLSGQIQIAVEKAGEETTAAQIGDILNSTVDVKTNLQLWSEALSDGSVVPFLLFSGAAIPFIGLGSAIAFLNSHPKYRPSVTTAFTLVSYLDLTTQHGILVKDGRTLELLNGVDTVVFDKTGTLTEEQPHVGYVHVCGDLNQEEVLALAAAAEQRQTHPIALAIVEAAAAQNLALSEVDEAAYKVGYGLTVTIGEQQIRVGSVRFIEMEGIAIPATLVQIQNTCYSEGHSLVLVAVDNQVAGAVELHASVRPEAAAVIQALRIHGIESMYIISGDHEAPTRKLAGTLGIDHYFAETLPEQKADLIDELQQTGKSVCYIGDGINDSIALKKAHISMSMRGASTVATDTANVVLMDGTLTHLPLLFELAREYQGNMRQTFAVTLLPSLIGAGGALFFHWGLVTTIILNQTGLLLGMSNAMRPKLQKLLTDKWSGTAEETMNDTLPTPKKAKGIPTA